MLTTLFSSRLTFFDSSEAEINTKYNNYRSVSKYVYITKEARKIWKQVK